MQENKSLFEHFEEIGRTISPKVQENKGLQNHHEFFRFLDIKNASVCTARRFYSYQK